MMFKIGDRVRVIPKEQIFYSKMYNLTTFIGTIAKAAEGCPYVAFRYSIIALAVLSKDLELIKIKGQQLEFAFMQTNS